MRLIPICLVALAMATALTAKPAAVAEVAKPFVPVFTTDFPDPYVLPHQGKFLAYATNATQLRANVQMAASDNLVDWALLKKPDGTLHDAMPVLPAWAKAGWTWAPEVVRIGEGYVLYFTARERASDRQCVGVATATDPRGPFVGQDSGPIVCQRRGNLGGLSANGAAILPLDVKRVVLVGEPAQ